MQNFAELVSNQKAYFETGETFDVSFRVERLRAFRAALLRDRDRYLEALWSDLHKGRFEAHVSELGLVLAELGWMIRKLPRLAKKRRVSTPLQLFPSRSYTMREPHGVCLIISPWNYPVQLCLVPLVTALSAGNTAVLKLSDRSPAVSQVVLETVRSVFDERWVAPIVAGPGPSAALLDLPFDMFFFTGSQTVGRLVCKAAAEKMVPAVLELGGKNPCVVLKDADIPSAAARIAWGKFFNAGQTCVAPDYLLVHNDIKDAFVQALRDCTTRFFGPDPKSSPDYCRLIDAGHTRRLIDLLGELRDGIDFDIEQRYIAPTFLDRISWDHPLMAEEIFGPVLPVFGFLEIKEAVARVKQWRDPLAAYVFSTNKKAAGKLFDALSFGGGCINDTLVHVSSPHLPFGGVGGSGMGRYHGEAGFDAFSRQKSLVVTPTLFSIPLRFPPYRPFGVSIVEKLVK